MESPTCKGCFSASAAKAKASQLRAEIPCPIHAKALGLVFDPQSGSMTEMLSVLTILFSKTSIQSSQQRLIDKETDR